MRAFTLVGFVVLATVAAAQSVDVARFDGMKWRNIGPARGGRSLAVTGSVQRPNEYFFGATGGGVWKTTNAGKDWSCVSDGYFNVGSVGAIAVAPSNPDIVYAGTGERDIRGNISHGDGVYRSDDAGRTWRHIGLDDTETISRIVVDPRNPNVVYAAALGHIYGFSGRRGVFKSTDGGQTWSVSLPGFEKAGAVDLVLDAKNPDILLAATWEAWRTPYSLNSGGPGSRIFKTSNAGQNWTDITQNQGLPTGIIGKVGLSISPVDPNRYFAMVENLEGGLFRSDDAGQTWARVNDNRNYRQRAWYFSHVFADTKDKDTVYVLNVGIGKSTDGGKTFRGGLNPPHGDNHDLWIAPDDPLRMIEANDGGATVTTDGGKTWTELDFPTAQFYHVSTDNAFPYRILGAQQDNSTVRIPSRAPGGIGKDSWTGTAGGESGYVAAKPNDPEVVYGGSYGGDLSMLDHRTGLRRAVDPWPDNPMGHGAVDLEHRFQWTFPIVFSPNDPNLLYTCSQFVLATKNGGESWERLSPDLTRNDKSRMQSSGGPITKDNTSVEYYGTVFTLAESPRERGLLWAGTDDGLIHVRRGGKWTNVTPKGLPDWGLVSMIEASPSVAGTAFAAVDNHENDDLRPYLFRTDDYGASWRMITNGLPTNSYVRTVRQDPVDPHLLFVGTETGVHVSFDGGQRWQPMKQNFPVCPVHDLVIKDGDLIAATHGRSFWVLDDISPLRFAAKVSAGNHLFAVPDAYRVRWGGPQSGVGANPPSGITASYYLAQDAKSVSMDILDAKGKKVGGVGSAPATAGFQRASAWLQEDSYRMGEGMIFWGAYPGPILLPPGEYSVQLNVDGKVFSQKVRLKKDPRLPATEADLQEQYRFQRKIADRVQQANDAVADIRKRRAALLAKPNLTPEETKMVADLTQVEEAIYQTKVKSGQDPLNYPIRLNNKLGCLFEIVSSGEWKPTRQSYEVYDQLSRQLQDQLDRLKAIK